MIILIKRFFFVIFVTSILCLITGCGLNFDSNNHSFSSEKTTDISCYYHYSDRQRPLSDKIQNMINSFCESGEFTPSDPMLSEYLDIPETENNAKGTDPICIVLPDLDLTKYKGPYFNESANGEWQIGSYYRMFAGMPTDEIIRIYVTSEGTIEKYETLNFGKYDNLPFDEASIEQLQKNFYDIISASTDPYMIELSENLIIPSAFSLYTDNNGQLIIKTTASLQDNRDIESNSTDSTPTTEQIVYTYYVDLYAKFTISTNQ